MKLLIFSSAQYSVFIFLMLYAMRFIALPTAVYDIIPNN